MCHSDAESHQISTNSMKEINDIRDTPLFEMYAEEQASINEVMDSLRHKDCLIINLL